MAAIRIDVSRKKLLEEDQNNCDLLRQRGEYLNHRSTLRFVTNMREERSRAVASYAVQIDYAFDCLPRAICEIIPWYVPISQSVCLT